MKSKTKNKSSFQLLIIDIFAFALLGVCVGLLSICDLVRYNGASESLLLGLAIPAFAFVLIGTALYLFVEYKFNRLKLKNIFLYFAFVIILINIIAIAVLPNKVDLPNGGDPLIITPIMRTYYLMSGFALAFIPYFCFYLIPRKILNRRYMNMILYIVLFVSVGLIVLSPIVEWQKYVEIFTGHFTNGGGLASICGHKDVFARMLLFGMFAAILLRIKKKNATWSLLLIPFYFFIFLSYSKITIVVATLTILTYLVIRLIMICKKNRDNLVITLSICGFVLITVPLFIVGIVRSESGVLFNIKKIFIEMGENAKTTLDSRLLIWQSAFQLLKPYQYIFGFGINSFDFALCNAYKPIAPTFDAGGAYHAHNFFVELIGRGGIVLLGIYLFLYAYLIYVSLKLRKKTPWLSTATIVFIIMSILVGMVEPVHICGPMGDNLILDAVIIFPIMSEYYLLSDKDERNIRREIVKQSKNIQKINFKNKILNLNKKRLIYEAKYITYDLNNKIKL